MVPIVYLASESLGCLAAESPYDVTGFDNVLVNDYNRCGNLITSNHAMAFHLSMLLIVKLFILPFERHVTLKDVKNFNLNLKHQILLVTIVVASFCSLFIFATRQEATSKYAYVYNVNMSHFLLMVMHSCWGVAFITFGLDAIKESKRQDDDGANHAAVSVPYWNRWLSDDDPYALAPVYRIFMVFCLFLMPGCVVYGLFNSSPNQVEWIYVTSALICFHFGLGAVYLVSNVRRRGYPWWDLLVYGVTIFGALFLMLLHEIIQHGFSRRMKVVELVVGWSMTIVFWPIVERARSLVKHLPGRLLESHMLNRVFSGESGAVAAADSVTALTSRTPPSSLLASLNLRRLCGLHLPAALCFDGRGKLPSQSRFKPARLFFLSVRRHRGALQHHVLPHSRVSHFQLIL